MAKDHQSNMRYAITTIILTAVSVTAAQTTHHAHSDAVTPPTQKIFAEDQATPEFRAIPENQGDVPVASVGGPPNNRCSSATVIPGNVVNYDPPLLNTIGALTVICDPVESCEVGNVGTSNAVWYSYTPDADGTIRVNTSGSTYNTVLSIFDRCSTGIFPPCNPGQELVCNDNQPFGNQAASVLLDVRAGQNYRIRVSDYDTNSGGGFLNFNLSFAPANDLCSNATIINNAIYDPPLISTHNALTDLCEAPETCEFNNVGVSNSVWYRFDAPCDGAVDINTNGSSYDTVLSIFEGFCGEFIAIDAPCNLPIEIDCDDDAGIGTNSRLIDVPVVGGETYIIKVSDYNTTQGGGFLDFNFSFQPADAPIADITEPNDLECNCALIEIVGSAGNIDGGPVEWTLDYRNTTGGDWTNITSNNVTIMNDLIAVWNTTSLPQGTYLLRLTVDNACGEAETDIVPVFIDTQFDNLELRLPPPNSVLAGGICIDGSAWDRCFDSYTVNFRPTAGGQFIPVDPDNPTYTQAVLNDPLATWGTGVGNPPDGPYEIQLAGLDTCGFTATDSRVFTIDNTPPTAEITAPLACAYLDGVIEFVGTANDNNLQTWVLQYAGGDQSGWTTIASGNDPVIDDTLATWDTTSLPTCAYTVRLIVVSQALLNCDDNVRSEYTVSINVGDLCPVDLDGDGDQDLADFAIYQQCNTGPLP